MDDCNCVPKIASGVVLGLFVTLLIIILIGLLVYALSGSCSLSNLFSLAYASSPTKPSIVHATCYE